MAVTAAEFRRLALSFPEATAGTHQDHPDFRVGGKVFATLGYPRVGYGMVKLPPKEQVFFIEAEPKAFQPAAGAWGLKGATIVLLRAAKKASVQKALGAAWRHTAPKIVAAKLPQS